MTFSDQQKQLSHPGPVLSFASVVVALVFVFLCYFNFINQSRARKFLMTFNGPTPLPIIGNALLLWDPLKFFEILRTLPSKYGSRIRLLIGCQNILYISHPDDIKTVLHSNDALDKGIAYKFLRPYLGNGLIVSSGEIWQSRRKFLNPAFHRASMVEHFLKVFMEQASVMMNVFTEEIQGNNSEIRLHSAFQRLTLDTLCDTSLGVKMHCQLKQAEDFFSAFKNTMKITNDRITKPWLHPDFIFAMTSSGRETKSCIDYLNSFVFKIIKSRKDHLMGSTFNEAYPNEKDSPNSKQSVQILLDILIRAQLSGDLVLTDQDIKDELMVFMFAGYDTTASAMFWAVMLLAAYPEAQAELHAELDSVFGKDNTRPLLKEDLPKLKFLDACVKESLRLYPSSGLLLRELKNDFKLDSETIIPKGVEIAICTYATQFQPEYFPNPMEFIPSRHYSASSNERHPCAFLPFSAGPRNCVGQKYALLQEKVVLAQIFRNFKVTPVDSIRDIRQIPQITVVPSMDGRCRFERRGDLGPKHPPTPHNTR